MANQILLTDNLADNVTFTISRNPSKDNLGSIYNDPSVFTVFFHSSYYLNKIGIFDGYCIQPWIAIGDNKYTADIYYSTEDFSILTKVDLNQDSVADETFELTDEKVQPVTFVLNNLSWEQLDADEALEGVIRDDNDNILNPTDASGNYIYLEIADVQYLIWDLIYDFYAPDYAGSPVFNETDYGVRALNTTTNAILKNNVVPHAENYIANEAGDKVGIIIKPDLNKQYIITTIKKSDIPDYTEYSQINIFESQNTSYTIPIPESSSIMGLLVFAILILLTRIKAK
jgi:hypothetical protein